jgi:hypothetical protein
MTGAIGKDLETVEKLLDQLENNPKIDRNGMERAHNALDAAAGEMQAAPPNSLNSEILEECGRRFRALCKREDGDRH